MNQVVLIGRLARDPELRYSPNTQTAVAHFTLAVDRERTQQGDEQNADFIRITVFGKQAETVDRYLSKGRQCAVTGRIQTGSYQNKDGQTVYTTDVIANRVEFLGGRNDGGQGGQNAPSFGGNQGSYNNRGSRNSGGQDNRGFDDQSAPSFGGNDESYPEGFQAVEDDLPF